jgi:hypothetical protein
MSAAKSARRLNRATFVLGLLAAGPLAAQPLESEPAPVDAAPVDAAPIDPAASAPSEPTPVSPDADTPAPSTVATPAPTLSPAQQIAKELFERGREKWRLREYAEAADLFTASNQQRERAGTLLMLGESLERLGRLRGAHSTFQRAVEVAKRENDPVLEARGATRAAAILPMIPKMEIRFSVPPPESTLVTLNGVELPLEWLNRAVPYDAGEYRLDVRAPGHAPYSAQIVLTNDAARLGVQVVPVTLTALLAPPEPAPLVVAPAPAPEDAAPSSQRQLAWISGGVGAAAAVTGVTLLLVALDKKSDASNICSEGESGKPDPCTPHGVSLRRQAKKLANLATASGIVAGAGLATSLTLFLMTEQEETLTGAGLRYSGTF